MTELSQLVDLAACLSITATTEDSRELADRKRNEALAAIEQEQEKLNRYLAKLAYSAQEKDFDIMERTYSTPRKLSDLAEVAKTRTPIFDNGRHGGDIRIKLDTDVNNHEWYVVTDDSQSGTYFVGMVNCWAFPHFNGSHDFYRYIPVKFCFTTFTEVLLAYPEYAELIRWIYDEEEYTTRQYQAEQERLRQIDNAVIDAYRSHTGILEVSKVEPFEAPF